MVYQENMHGGVNIVLCPYIEDIRWWSVKGEKLSVTFSYCISSLHCWVWPDITVPYCQGIYHDIIHSPALWQGETADLFCSGA